MLRIVGAVAIALAFQDEGLHQNSYKGKAPPELVADKSQWINSKEAVKLEAMKGKVVWLEFSFLG